MSTRFARLPATMPGDVVSRERRSRYLSLFYIPTVWAYLMSRVYSCGYLPKARRAKPLAHLARRAGRKTSDKATALAGYFGSISPLRHRLQSSQAQIQKK